MFAAHFGLAAAVKAKSPEVPLWSLMIGTQLLDIFFVPLFISGTETIEQVDGGGYGNNVIHADFTHSLTGALLIALLAGLLAGRFWGKRGGFILGSVVFSHWLLDLLVHRADMPILPGNALDLPLLGLGLWKFSAVSTVIEAIIIVVGLVMYFRSVMKDAGSARKGWACTAGGVMGLLLVLALITDVFGIGS